MSTIRAFSNLCSCSKQIWIGPTLLPLALLAAFLASPTPALAAPGEVLSEAKISATSGGFMGTLTSFNSFGEGVSSLGDLDGDGIDELVVGANTDGDGGFDSGAVWILFMNADATVKAEQKISLNSGNFQGSFTAASRFGTQIAPLGDFDGDGLPDLAVSAPDDSTEGTLQGAVFLLYLNSDGTVKETRKIDTNVPGFFYTIGSGDRFGSGLAVVGDLDGDGLPELAVGSEGYDDPSSSDGAAWILYLGREGNVRYTIRLSQSLTPGLLGSLAAGDDFGSAIAGIGDLDGNGVPDLAVGAQRDDDGGTNRGAVWIVFLPNPGNLPFATKISQTTGGFTGTLTDGEFFGSALTAPGDLNGDGIPDLAVGSPFATDGGTRRGAVTVLFMNTDGTVSSHLRIGDGAGGFMSGLNLDNFGSGLAGIRSLDGSGLGGILVGADGDDDTGTNVGAAWVLELEGAANLCGDGVIDPLETCDDGNSIGLDGCSMTCEVEREIAFYGVAQTSGIASFGVDEINVDVSISASDPPASVANLATAAINSNAALLALGTTAESDGHRVVINGRPVAGPGTTANGMVAKAESGLVLSTGKISAVSGGFGGAIDNGDRFGTSVTPIGDLDGDGVADVAVGAPSDDDGGSGRGAVWILLMNADGTVKSESKISSTQGSFMGTLADGDNFGRSVASIGDLDDDGVIDLAVGASGAGGGNEGAIWVVFLNANGTVKAHQEISTGEGGFSDLLDPADGFGSAVAGIGDLDRDGIPDLAVGEIGDDDAGTDTGALWVLLMNANGTVKSDRKITEGQSGFSDSLSSSALFGAALASLGDLDGDRINDLAVGASEQSSMFPRGDVWILFMNTDGTVRESTSLLETGFRGAATISSRFGSSLGAVGDVNGDGVQDLAVGAPGDFFASGGDGGVLFLLFLNPDGTIKGHRRITEGDGGFAGDIGAGDLFGSSIAALGDLDGDGGTNFAIGALGDPGGGSVRGAVWLLSLESAKAFCGDDVLIYPETCDDGGEISGDGCFSTCEVESEIAFFGVGQGGTVQLSIDGVNLIVPTTTGQTSADVALAATAVANATPALVSRGISTLSIDSRVITTGLIDSASSTDAGIFVPEPAQLPALATGLGLLCWLGSRRSGARSHAEELHV